MIAIGGKEPQTVAPTRRGIGLTRGSTLAAVLLVCWSFAAAAQQPPAAPAPVSPGSAAPAPAAQPQQLAPSDPAPPIAPPAPAQGGLFQMIGRWVDDSISRAGALWGGDVRKGTGIDLLSKTKIVSGHERCETAPNGAPDCRAAVEALCRSKGLGTGNSLDVQSVENCPARAWISGTHPKSGECRMDSYVQRALCQ